MLEAFTLETRIYIQVIKCKYIYIYYTKHLLIQKKLHEKKH